VLNHIKGRKAWLFLCVLGLFSLLGLSACGGTQPVVNSEIEQVSTVKSWSFDSSLSDDSATALLAAQLIDASQFDRFFYTGKGFGGGHKRIDSRVLGDSIRLDYKHHPRGDAPESIYAISSVEFPIEVVREQDQAFIYVHSPTSFSAKQTSNTFGLGDVSYFADKPEIIADAQKVFRSLAVTALKRRIDGDGVQKYVPMSAGVVAMELYVSTGCQVDVGQQTPAVCEFDDVFVEAWVSEQGKGALLVIDFFQEYIVRGADALALDRALTQLEDAQSAMLATLDLPLTE